MVGRLLKRATADGYQRAGAAGQSGEASCLRRILPGKVDGRSVGRQGRFTVEGQVVISTDLLEGVHALAVIGRQGQRALMQLRRAIQRVLATGGIPGSEQRIVRLGTHRLALARIGKPGQVGILAGDGRLVVVGDQLDELVGPFPCQLRIQSPASACARARLAFGRLE